MGITFSVRETTAKFSPMIDGIYTFSVREIIAIFSPSDYWQFQSIIIIGKCSLKRSSHM